VALNPEAQSARYGRPAPPPPGAAAPSAPTPAPRLGRRRLAPLPTQGSSTSLESIDYAEAWGVNGRKGTKPHDQTFSYAEEWDEKPCTFSVVAEVHAPQDSAIARWDSIPLVNRGEEAAEEVEMIEEMETTV
jgi:hypothetical protein